MSALGCRNRAAMPPEPAIVAALGARSVVLVGMMGAGKSSIGRRLAVRLGIPFVDADTEIEAAAGMTIPEIFESHGEPYFRAGEGRVIARLLDGGPQVLATGGGAFMNADTRATIRARGVSFWLNADFDVLLRRVRRRTDRPRLTTADPEETLAASGIGAAGTVVRAGEPTKNWRSLEQVCDALRAARIERGDLVVALGGGVVGALAGFAAAITRRGLGVVQVPTTLLAQVDSSVGGKTGINSAHGKNLIGAFHQPAMVLADTALLDTLQPRDFRPAYAEVAKCALINDPSSFAWLGANWG